MAPFLDQSLDTAVQRDARAPLPKQPASKDKSRQDQQSALQGDQSRPKTSTGMRGNGIFQKIGGTHEEVNPHSILPSQNSNLPTKTNFQSL